MMDEERYEAWTARLRANPASVQALHSINNALTYLGYILYPVLLVYAALYEPHILARLVIVPAVLFVAVSVFRRVYNAPRPYEALDIDPLIHKSTRGKSFPSRHIFSMFMIAMCYLYVWLPVGCMLCICGAVMAFIRVLGGVHFPKDVIAGALIAVVGGALGLWIIPWP